MSASAAAALAQEPWIPDDVAVGNVIVTPAVVLAAWLLLTSMFAWLGRRQRREAEASKQRLWLAAFAMAALVLLPTSGALLFGEALDISWGAGERVIDADEFRQLDEEQRRAARRITHPEGAYYYALPSDGTWGTVVLGVGYSGLIAPANLLLLALATVWLLQLGLGAMRPVHRQLGAHDPLPRVEDPALRARIDELAAAIGVRPPATYVLGSTSGERHVQAAAGGVMAPVVIVTDGIVERLGPDDVGAIVAHELGHVRGRDVWSVVAILSAAMTIMVASSGWLFPLAALALGVLVARLLLRTWGRRAELRCDLLAARAVGAPAMAAALDRIHAANPVPCGPRIRRWFHASSTHPADSIRRDHLARHAPAGERAALAADVDEVARQRRVDRVVFALGPVALAVAVLAGLVDDLKWPGVGVVAAFLLLPYGARLLALLRPLVLARRIGFLRVPWRRLLRLGLSIAALATVPYGLGEPWAWPTWLALAVIVALAVTGVRRRRREQRLDAALRARDVDLALQRLAELPRAERRQPTRRLQHATLLAATRRDAEAIAVLESLATDRPRYWTARMYQSAIASWRDPARGLAIIDAVAAAIVDHPWVLAVRAACLSRLGRHEAAWAELERARALDDDDPRHLTTQAVLASRMGDTAAAMAWIDRAERSDPGALVLELARARTSLLAGDLDAAEARLAAAAPKVAADPMALLWFDCEALRDRLQAARAAS